jgi:ATP synthase F1 delta subunit
MRKEIATIAASIHTILKEDSSHANIQSIARVLSKESTQDRKLILNTLKKQLLSEEQSIEATVSSVIPLTNEQLQAITSFIKDKHNVKEVYIHQDIDKTILGGLKIKIGDMVYDSSLKQKLSQVRKKII